MMLRVLVEAHRDVGRIDELDEVRVSAVHTHEVEQDAQRNERVAVHRTDKRVVRTAELFLEVSVDGYLPEFINGTPRVKKSRAFLA